MPKCCVPSSGGLIRLETLARLGPLSVARVAAYRIGLRSGLHPVQRVAPRPVRGRFFFAPIRADPPAQRKRRTIRYFGWLDVPVEGDAPRWFANPLKDGPEVRPDIVPWWSIPDFGPAGDIKILWEPSRFGWCLDLALEARDGDPEAAETLNRWLADWCWENPAYLGPNWKCGQECSIRVMHLAMASLLLGEDMPSETMQAFVYNHLQRIAPTIGYAVGQDNNHGTSEAAALFIGGSWLDRAGVHGARKWAASGRRWLEERLATLVAPDGSFSQYSLNYHRVMLDTLCMAEIWRRHHQMPAFSARFNARAQAATRWLHAMIDLVSGDGPNVGANDGAHLFNPGGAAYRDFRPSVQTAAILFAGRRAYPDEGDWDRPARLMGLGSPEATLAPPASVDLDDGGFAVLRSREAMAMLRYPRFRFRPSQCDALHVDLWLAGENLLSDAGTYSYNAGTEWLDYFAGTEGHNSVMFDGRDQMPRLGRFLFGKWLTTLNSRIAADAAEAGYTDWRAASHHRAVELQPGRLVVTDTIAGFEGEAVLRWRLRPGLWRVAEDALTDGVHRLRITLEAGAALPAIEEGWRSLHYLTKESVPVAILRLTAPAAITTTYEWA